jgi:hypothetical protein
MKHELKFSPYTHAAGGWGSVQSLGRSLVREHVPLDGPCILAHQNKPDGFACVSCAWALSAPTNLAVRAFTHPERIGGDSSRHSAYRGAIREAHLPIP